MTKTIWFKIDVDTERGTRIGVPQLQKLFQSFSKPATFLFSLGPDQTGRAIKKVLRPDFFKKVSRTSVVSTYGFRTLLNGTLLPAPFIAKKHSGIMRAVFEAGFEVGIHCYNHIRWQDGVTKMPEEKIQKEFTLALKTFKKVFGTDAHTAGAPGWQSNQKTLNVYDRAHLLYGSDCRGNAPFYPKIGDTVFETLQIPTTLPTLDELIGRKEYPIESLTEYFLSLLSDEHPNVMTIHAELEGMKYYDWFSSFLKTLTEKNIGVVSGKMIAENALKNKDEIPVCEYEQGTIDGRSGLLAVQGKKI